VFVAAVVLCGSLAVGASPASAAHAGYSIQPSPNPGGSGNTNSLNGVSCVSHKHHGTNKSTHAKPTRCVAVGSYYDGSRVRTLVEVWDGRKWSVAASPNQGTFDNYLFAVSCVSETRCVAVGLAITSSAGTSASTLVEAWDGTTWSIVPSPNPQTVNVLSGVSCADATHCVAVGYKNNTNFGYSITTLIETWDGTTWSVSDSPNPGLADTLTDVSCTSTTRCVAVGDHNNSIDGYRTLVETWDGSAWSVTPSANLPGTINVLIGVSCTSPTACVAVGTHVQNIAETLVETWDGTAWSIVPSPSPGTEYDATNSLNSVSCVSATSCVAVGGYYDGAVSAPTLVETWDGTSWTVTPSPNQVALGNTLNGVSCVSTTSCVAIGTYFNGSRDQTLVVAATR
jgi:hypothetical protein